MPARVLDRLHRVERRANRGVHPAPIRRAPEFLHRSDLERGVDFQLVSLRNASTLHQRVVVVRSDDDRAAASGVLRVELEDGDDDRVRGSTPRDARRADWKSSVPGPGANQMRSADTGSVGLAGAEVAASAVSKATTTTARERTGNWKPFDSRALDARSGQAGAGSLNLATSRYIPAARAPRCRPVSRVHQSCASRCARQLAA